jgi:hypothetical protein
MVDDLDGDAAGGGFVEGAGGVAVEGGPGVFVDFGFEGGFEGLVGVVCAEEAGVADEEAVPLRISTTPEPARLPAPLFPMQRVHQGFRRPLRQRSPAGSGGKPRDGTG